MNPCSSLLPVFGACCRRSLIRSFSSKPTTTIRLSKWLSKQLQVSRKEAERQIRAGSVRLAGKPVPSPAASVSQNDLSSITLNGKKVEGGTPMKSPVVVWLIHKIRGALVTSQDPRDRAIVVPPIKNGIFVGRLDMNTEGLLLCTNCGDYARELELPKNCYHRVYRVRVHGKLDDKKLRALGRGIRVDEKTWYAGMKVVLETKKRSTATNQWLQITCTRGQNRQIRKALEHLGLTVSRLIRVSFGDYELGNIPPGRAILAAKKVSHKRKGPLFLKKILSKEEKPKQVSDHNVRWVKAA